MAILKEKTDYLLEVKSKYTYRIFTNGNGEMTVEVQLTEDFKAASLRNFALATITKEDFVRTSLGCLNHLLLTLRKRVAKDGAYYENLPIY